MKAFAILLTAASLAFASGELSNRRAPGFSLPDSTLAQHDLADYLGQVVVVNFMQTQCPHCAAFSKVLARVEQRYGSKVKVLSVVSHRDSQAAVKSYKADNGLSTTFLFDCGQMTASYLELTPQNPSFSTPHFFVIDQKGWIQDDYGHSALAKEIFEGEGIFDILDRYVSKDDVAD